MRVPWTARRSNQSILKEISPEYSLKGLMLELKLQYFSHLMQRTHSLGKTLMLRKIEGRRRRGQQSMRWLDCEAARVNTMTGSPDLSLGFPQNGKIPYPHQATWSQPINMRPVGKRESIRRKLKSLQTPKFEKSLQKFGPIKLLCKHVTNLLKPATNCLCSPYKFV